MIPLAERMRPKCLEDFVGQKQLSLLYEMINNDAVSSMIFWGPPGVGKTTLAKIIAHRSQSYFVEFSAVTSGIKEIKKVMEEAKHENKITDHTNISVNTEVLSDVDASGKQIMNYKELGFVRNKSFFFEKE